MEQENPPTGLVPTAMKWWGWGDPQIRYPFAERPGFQEYLREHLTCGEFNLSWHPDPGKFTIPESRVSVAVLNELAEHIGHGNVSTDHLERLRHSFGRSYVDLLHIRRHEIPFATDAVLFPESEDHLLEILQWADSHNIAVVPFGGGTSVVGGVNPEAGGKLAVVTVSLRRLNRVIYFDRVSQTVTVEAGILGPNLEAQLADYGYCLGHYPQSFEFSTVGGWVAARSSGQNSVLYGGIEKLVSALRVVSAKGITAIDLQPRHAVGPDLREVFVGSEGSLGIISQVTLRVSPAPKWKSYKLLMFEGFDSATTAARQLVQEHVPVAMARVSDETETEVLLSMALGKKGIKNKITKKVVTRYLNWKKLPVGICSAMLVGFEGSKSEIRNGWSQLRKSLKHHKYASLGKGPGRHWLKDRFTLPYLRDDLLDQKILIETFETAGTWTNYLPLYQAVQECIKNSLPERHVLLCHLSHLYSNGASLYFTVIANQRAEGGEVRQWEEVKKNLNMTIMEAHGVISHHHGVGVDHRDFTCRSPLEKEILMDLKSTVDPKNILNPGKLFEVPGTQDIRS